MALLDYFESGFTPSKIQVDIINKIEECLEDRKPGKKFIIISAPTGTGKSFIAKTIANYCDDIDPVVKKAVIQKNTKNIDWDNVQPGGSFVLTITKSLQDQYASLFYDASVFKGKSNYTCALNTKLDCEIGACSGLPNIKKKCVICDKCPYYNAMQQLFINKFGVLNYASFFKLNDDFKHRQFLICDEASELEDELVNNFSLDITYRELKKYNIIIDKLSLNADRSTIRNWIDILYNEVIVAIENCENDIKNSKTGFDISLNAKLLRTYKFLTNLEKTLCNIDSGFDECEYIRDGDDERVILSPLYIKNLAKHIFDYADTIILMSATIINHKKYAETLGITDYTYIEGQSVFDPKKSPICVAKGCELNYKNLDILLPKLIDTISKICDKHKDEKGIIHTHTQKITNYIKDNLDNDRLTVRYEKITNEDILKVHKDKPNSILVSPSMTFGVDLKDDLARFQIIIKMPFLPLSNKRIKILAERDRDWYLMKMFTNLIQASGRGVRSADDYCITYILDSTLINLLLKYTEYLPKYFVERFR